MLMRVLLGISISTAAYQAAHSQMAIYQCRTPAGTCNEAVPSAIYPNGSACNCSGVMGSAFLLGYQQAPPPPYTPIQVPQIPVICYTAYGNCGLNVPQNMLQPDGASCSCSGVAGYAIRYNPAQPPQVPQVPTAPSSPTQPPPITTTSSDTKRCFQGIGDCAGAYSSQ